jgi:hypothetical protein
MLLLDTITPHPGGCPGGRIECPLQAGARQTVNAPPRDDPV